MQSKDEEEHEWPIIAPQRVQSEAPHFPSLSADLALSLSSRLNHDELETQLIVYDTQNNPWNVIRRDPITKTVVLFSPAQKSVVVTDDNALVLFDSEAVPQSALLHRDYFRLLQEANVMEKNRRGVRSEKSDDPHNISPESLNSGYYKKFFVEERNLGRGSYGAVFLVRHQINGIHLGYYALKKVPVGDDLEWLKIVMTEVAALETLRLHPNIVNYKHSWLESDQIADFGPKVPCLNILMEYANSGNLEEYVSEMAEIGGFSEAEIWTYFIDTLFGVEYLHSMGIIHRDIKASNLMLHRDVDVAGTPQRRRVLLTDFGTCIMMEKVAASTRTGHTGTPEWVAPELLAVVTEANSPAPQTAHSHGSSPPPIAFFSSPVHEDEGSSRRASPDSTWGSYDAKCDIWSLGLVLYFMAYGRLPWTASREDEEELNREIRRGHVHLPDTPSRSREMRAVIRTLLQIDPSKRPSSRDLLMSSFFKQLITKINDPQQMRLLRQFLAETSHGPFYDQRTSMRSTPPPSPPAALRRRTSRGALPPPENARMSSVRKSQELAEHFERPPSPLLMAPPHRHHHAVRLPFAALHFAAFICKVALCLFHCGLESAHPLYSFVSVVLASVSLLRHETPRIVYATTVIEILWALVAAFVFDGPCNLSAPFASLSLALLLSLSTAALTYLSSNTRRRT